MMKKLLPGQEESKYIAEKLSLMINTTNAKVKRNKLKEIKIVE
jgi:hypothetical protein